MYQRKVNLLLIVFSVIGGVIGFAAGEALLYSWEGRIPNWLLMGAYFGQLALFVGLMCLIAEQISPELNGKGWRLRYAKDGWKLLVPATLLLLLIAGGVLQFVYGLYFGKHQPPHNILVSIDVSESMAETDPGRESFRAAKQLVQNMEPDKRVAVMTFNDQANLLQPLTPVDNQAAKDAVTAKLDSFGRPTGGTNIGAALAKAMEQIEAAQAEARGSMVILISDGYSEVDLNSSLMPYTSKDIAVNTVGVNAQDRQGNELLKRIASRTGGTYHSVEDVQNLSAVFEKIYKANQGWHLVGERTGSAVNSLYYAVLRIVCMTLIGLLMGLSLGIVFDNRYLARSFSIGGAIAGLAAGFILEEGLKGGFLPGGTVRGAADIVLAVVLSLSTLIFAYKESRTDDAGQGLYKRSRNGSGRTFGQNGPTNRKFQ
ncbi:VWA domain-containing protein [Paenibacillus mesophilus]|uniref:vWA domain-containing protein n=1 Tax=Paenibacillus mesophilus TaxID=2582849 RepID=UPI00110DDE99|nr:vWA domain-containing protein [Paenibacillus mesophilus]TMV45810.1 VWA domain-containing protein [Paenibacillus mesophilus]